MSRLMADMMEGRTPMLAGAQPRSLGLSSPTIRVAPPLSPQQPLSSSGSNALLSRDLPVLGAVQPGGRDRAASVPRVRLQRPTSGGGGASSRLPSLQQPLRPVCALFSSCLFWSAVVWGTRGLLSL